MKLWISIVAVFMTFCAHAGGDLILNVTLDYDLERHHTANQSAINELSEHLAKRVGQPVRLVMTQNAERVGERIRTGAYDVILAPAQLIGLAMRYGYTPVARTDKPTRILLVGSRKSGLRGFEQTRGKRIVLPHRDSLVSEMVRGELNAKGFSLNGYYSRVIHVTSYGAAMYALQMGQADVAAIKEEVMHVWAPRDPDLAIIATLAEVPAAGVAVKAGLDEATKERVRRAFTAIEGACRHGLRASIYGSSTPPIRPISPMSPSAATSPPKCCPARPSSRQSRSGS